MCCKLTKSIFNSTTAKNLQREIKRRQLVENSKEINKYLFIILSDLEFKIL